MQLMKTLSAALLAAATFAAPAAHAAPPICLHLHDIVGTDSKDGKTLTFRMRDGTILRNHLQSQCNGLIFNGFAWVLRGTDEVCENAQTLRVLQSGEVCALGKFDPPVKPAKHA